MIDNSYTCKTKHLRRLCNVRRQESGRCKGRQLPYNHISTHVPWFQSFFMCFALAKLATSSMRVTRCEASIYSKCGSGESPGGASCRAEKLRVHSY